MCRLVYVVVVATALLAAVAEVPVDIAGKYNIRGESNISGFYCTISVYGSSCNSLFFGLFFPSLSTEFLGIPSCRGMSLNRKRNLHTVNEAEKARVT